MKHSNGSNLKIFPFVLCLWCFGAGAQSLQIDGFGKTSAVELKRGKEYTVRWTGVTDVRKEIVLALHNRYGDTLKTWRTFVNDGEETIDIDRKLKPQKGYRLSMSLVGEETEFVKAFNIRIRRKVPLGVTLAAAVVPVVAAAAVIFLPEYLDSRKEEEPEPANGL
jgi:hypothetical protein